MSLVEPNRLGEYPGHDNRLRALNLSIMKWENILLGTGFDLGSLNCECCVQYLKNRDANGTGCYGCPVRDAVGAASCHRTPYEKWRHDGPRMAFRAIDSFEGYQAALEELRFLKKIAAREHKLGKSLRRDAEGQLYYEGSVDAPPPIVAAEP